MTEHDPVTSPEPPERRWWAEPGAWVALIAVALFVYELTADPAVSAAIGCAKFGWEDVRTAHWLRRRDPDRRRGKTCFWFYVASGVWKIMLTALIVMFGIAFVEGIRHANRQANPAAPPEFLFILLEAFGGFLLVCTITFGACCCALARRVKVWVDSRVHLARRRNEWPPIGWQANRAGRLVITAMLFPVMILIVAFVVLVAPHPGRLNPNVRGDVLGVLCIVLTATPGIVILVVRDIVGRRIIASTPWECWHEVIDDTSEHSLATGPSGGPLA